MKAIVVSDVIFIAMNALGFGQDIHNRIIFILHVPLLRLVTFASAFGYGVCLHWRGVYIDFRNHCNNFVGLFIFKYYAL